MSIQQSNYNSSNGDRPKISVMLVDDDPAFLRITNMLLHTHYAEKVDVVGTARNGEECLTVVQTLAPQVIVMDLNMPGMSGLLTIPLLHILFPETRVIALTFDDRDESRRAALAAGASDLISKAEMKTYLFPAIEEAITQDPIDTVMMAVTV